MTEALVIRPAVRDDLDAILAIERAVFTDPWAPSSFASEFGDPCGWFRVGCDGAGTVRAFALSRFVADQGELMNIAVAPAWRGRGEGGRLLDDAVAAAVAAGCEAMWLEVRASNAGAQALYAGRGFALVGKRRGYYRKPVEDAWVYRRTLSPAGAAAAAEAGVDATPGRQ